MTPEERVIRLIDQSTECLSPEGLEGIRHYIDHGEFEIALEGLVLELAKAQVKPPGFNYGEWAQLLADLGLQTDSVLEGDLWNIFQKWASSPDCGASEIV